MQRAARQFWRLLALVVAPGTVCADTVETPGADRQVSWRAQIRPLPGSNDPRLADLSDQLTEELGAEALAEAEVVAKRLVELVSAEEKASPILRARALNNLALVQHLRADHAAAILNYRAAVDAIAEGADMLNGELVAPLHGLGLVHADSGDPLAAIEAYDRALHVSNVNAGPHSLAQEPVLQSMLALHERQGDPASAEELLDRIYQLHLRAGERDTEAMLPVLRQRAAFYRRHGRNLREYRAWEETLDILRDNRGAGDVSLIEPLLNLADNMIRGMDRVSYRSGPTAPSAAKHLRRALAIARQNPEADAGTKTRVLLAIGDFYILLGNHTFAHRYFGETWTLLSAEGEFDRRARELESVQSITAPRPGRYANFKYGRDIEDVAPEDYEAGRLVAEFTVNVRGRAEDIRIVEATPPNFDRMEWRLQGALKDFVYRPRFEAGAAAATPGIRYQLDYFYLPDEYEDSLAESGKLKRPRAPDPH